MSGWVAGGRWREEEEEEEEEEGGTSRFSADIQISRPRSNQLANSESTHLQIEIVGSINRSILPPPTPTFLTNQRWEWVNVIEAKKIESECQIELSSQWHWRKKKKEKKMDDNDLNYLHLSK